MHPLLEQTFETGTAELPDGSHIRVNSSITYDDCLLVERMIQKTAATSAIEVGMAFGISSLAIASSLLRRDETRYVVIDPHQSHGWKNAGVHLLRRAGLADMVQLIEEPSQLVLPRLAAQGERFDFVFIDGWHTFDHALVDFFFCDMLLNPGGVMMLDDVGYPAIDRVVRFILSNRDYELVGATRVDEEASRSLQWRRKFKRAVRPIARTDRDPSPAFDLVFSRLERAQVVALEKLGEDSRRFDHFEAF
ncbi:MAG TPA: class I SAM-dependent methyltransferase [Thermoanaerobaculia bacterium]|nr:class I SAM-dependent methyltransferase [Thermoanaerobaculia bacterium]